MTALAELYRCRRAYVTCVWRCRCRFSYILINFYYAFRVYIFQSRSVRYISWLTACVLYISLVSVARNQCNMPTTQVPVTSQVDSTRWNQLITTLSRIFFSTFVVTTIFISLTFLCSSSYVWRIGRKIVFILIIELVPEELRNVTILAYRSMYCSKWSRRKRSSWIH